MKRLLMILLASVVTMLLATSTALADRKLIEDKKVASTVKKDRQIQSTIESVSEIPAATDEAAAGFEEIDWMQAADEMTNEADAYIVPWKSINGGGGTSEGGGYRASVSIGQTLIGKTENVDYAAGIGYWYGIPAGGDCDCGSPWANVTADDIVNPVDVVIMINYVYKNIDTRVPLANCPYEAGDVTCDDTVNPVDVVHYINWVYKNITPFPCTDPCVP